MRLFPFLFLNGKLSQLLSMGHDTVMSNLRLVARISVSLLAVLLAWLGFLFTRSRGVLADMIVIISLAWILSRLLVFVLGRRWGYRSAFVIAVGAALAGETASFLRSNTFVGWIVGNCDGYRAMGG
jgi:hypothetical protein